ncbi:hypothetical protein B0A55_00129 [Friedmanniomyces simplex]|uniref:Uncharacterized protein n=1 Tax=Friedmanniomyces simplex TaxID=329884 RepID=A0A4U0Y4T2_9PEZI|nr:hypothetical protein B0A55_00129 [Friedmanniomyces simplex]
MVLGEQNGAKLTWPAVKKLCTQSDIDRLACLAVAFINSGPVDQAIYTAAANQFGSGIKPDSYKRGLWVISKRIKDAQASGKLDGGGSPVTPGKGERKGSKRAAGDDGDRDDEEVETPKRSKKEAAASRREIKKEVEGELGHASAKDKEAGDDLDNYFS